MDNRYINFIRSLIRDDIDIDKRFLGLYQDIQLYELKLFFAQKHEQLIRHFKFINDRLETGRYLADASRDMISLITDINTAMENLSKSKYSFTINEYYKNIINRCDEFLSMNYGSIFPDDFNRIQVIEVEPIFILDDNMIVNKYNNYDKLNLKLIGDGSYANVYKYYDKYYKTYFAMKIAKRNLSDKELYRFKNEFEQMKKLKSPYIIKVFKYDIEKNAYTMELADTTINKYISKNNNILSIKERKSIVSQIFRAFYYLQSKEILHRDISTTNLLLKIYDDVKIVKISDFGLIKLKNSNLTSLNTEFKGSLNDPQLQIEGFAKYNKKHEVYALTRLIYFVLTGKYNMDNIQNKYLKEFVTKGVNSNKDIRYDSIENMREEFLKIANYL